MAISTQMKNQHLLWRAGFGPVPEESGQIVNVHNPIMYYDALAKASAPAPDYIDVAKNAFDGLAKGVGDIVRMQQNEMTEMTRRQLRQASREALKSLNLRWLDEMINSDAQLREKMALFWHGHFACRVINIYHQQLLLDVIRRNALGKFGDLLEGVSKSGAMINFLNNNQNRKQQPNENFAREVMELFTMGRGNYTEQDIKEAARAFTGWGTNLRGDFEFRKGQHDFGSKTILGKTGNFDGMDVLKILLEQKQTARYLTEKIYRYFVNDRPDESKVNWLAARFYQSSYDIGALLRDIFTSDWFYHEKNIGTRIKSPIELIVGIRRMLPMQLENEQTQLLLQRLMSQVLFYPPNVAGWPGGKNWIDSSTLMLRLRLPQMIYAGDELNIRPKDDDDQQMGMMEGGQTPAKGKGKRAAARSGRQIGVDINWSTYIKAYEGVKREALIENIAGKLLQTKRSVSDSVLLQNTDASTRDSFIKTVTIQLMSTPEYQLC
jgi:uncharacterized protein (DUF1800 family)